MKRFFYKNRYGLTLMLVLALVLQTAGPIVLEYVYAGEEGKEEAETFEEIEVLVEEDEITSDDEINVEEDQVQPTDEESDEAEDVKETEKSQEKLQPKVKAAPTPLSGDDPVTFGAVKLKHVDSSGNEVDGDFKADSHVRIRFEYTIEDGKEVDTNKIYNFTIPNEIPIIATQNIELKDGDRHLANVVVNTDQTMTVQFLPEINNENYEDNRDGWIEIYSKFDFTDLGTGGDKTVDFEVDGKNTSVTVSFEEIEETEKVTLSKKGSYDKNTNEITWTITVKPETTPKGRTISNVKIEDIIHSGQTYIDDSAELNGVKLDSDPLSSDKLDYTFAELADGENQTISFKTKADVSMFLTQGTTIEFENKATGNYGEDSTSIESNVASVETTVDFIKKTGSYDSSSKKINWKIEVNNNNLDLPAGVTIEDIIGGGLKFNNDLKVDGLAYGEYGTLDSTDNSFKFIFTDEISEKHTITYSTDVIDPDAYNSNDQKTYNNSAIINWTGKHSPTSSGDIGVGVSTSVINKTGAGYDPATHKVTWKIIVNNNKIDITDPIVTDLLPDTLEYVDSDLPTGWTLTEPIEIESEKEKLEFKYNGTISTQQTITIVTKIKDEFKDYYGNNSTKTIYNTAKLTGTGVEDSQSTGNQTIKSQVIKKTAEAYDYITRKASWKIVVNQNEMPINNAVVTDTIIGDYHEFVADSLKIDGVEATPSQYSIIDNEITINLEDITTEKNITFETQIPEDKVDEFFEQNGDKNLKNKAKITGNEIVDGGVETSEISQKVENTVVSKTTKYTNGNDFIDWEVIINSNELDLTDVTLEDDLQDGLILDTTTVKLNKLNVKSNGSYDEAEERELTTTYTPLDNKVIFDIGNIKNAYILRFRTDVDDSKNNTTFNNTIKLKGSNGEQSGSSGSIGVAWQSGSAGGSGTSTRGSLIVEKVDKENPTLYLSGGKFQLLDKDKQAVKNSDNEDYILSTDISGKVIFEKLRMGNII